MGARTTTSTIEGVSRLTSCTVGRSSSFSRAINAAGETCDGRCRANMRLTTG